MAFSFQPLEAALDSLGVNYTDGVTVRIADKYTVKCDLNEVDALLQGLDPKVQSLHAEYDCAFEKQVLSDLEKYRAENERKEEERRKRIEEFDRRKAEDAEKKRKEEEERALEDERVRLEEIEKEKERLAGEARKRREEEEEAEKEQKRKYEEEKRKVEEQSRREEEEEWKRFEKERLNSESTAESQEENQNEKSAEKSPEICDNNKSFGFTNSTNQNLNPLETSSSFTTNQSTAGLRTNQIPTVISANQIASSTVPVITNPSPSQNVINKAPTKPVKINFSDFEAEADVFADMELKTINEFAELQTILAANQPASTTQVTQGNYMNGFFPNTTTIPSSAVISNPYQSSQIYQGSSVGFNGNLQASGTVQQAYRHNPFGAPTPNSQSPSGFSTGYPTVQTGSGFATSVAQTTSSYSAPAVQSGAGYPANSYQYPRPAYGNFYPGFQGGYPGIYPNADRFYPPHQFPQGPPQDPHQPLDTSNPPQDPHTTRAVSNPPQDPHQPNEDSSLPVTSRTRLGGGQMRSKSSDRSSGIVEAVEPRDKGEVEGELKPSRSVGDIISELQKEASLLAEHKRKHIQTPPPRPASRGASGLEDWVPWPKLGPTDPLEGLGAEERRMCSQLAEMGFPLSRLVTAVRSVGADSQKLISFCVLVDKYVEEGFGEDVSLDVVLLHASDEAASRKHLSGYQKLAEFGFEKQDIHKALIDSDLDHLKALDTLIK